MQYPIILIPTWNTSYPLRSITRDLQFTLIYSNAIDSHLEDEHCIGVLLSKDLPQFYRSETELVDAVVVRDTVEHLQYETRV